MFEDPIRDEIKNRISIFDIAQVSGKERVECPSPDCPGRYKNKQDTEIFRDGSGFKCYVCKTSGDVFTWEQLTSGVSYAEARRNLARMLGISLSPNKERTELLTRVVKEAHKFLFEDRPEKLEYFINRGISKSVLWRFGVGYIDLDHEVLRRSGLSRDQLAHLGLLYKSLNPNKKDTSAMEGRFIFPIRNTRGQLVQLKGRADPEALDAEVIKSKKSIPLMSEPFGSTWGRVSNQDFLFAEDCLHEALRAGYAILNEGEPDCLTTRSLNLHSFGLQGSEGLGRHAHKFKGISKIYVMLDNDAATQHTLLKELYEFQTALPNETIYCVKIPALRGYDSEGNALKVDANDLKAKFGWNTKDFKQLMKEAPEVRNLLIESWGPQYKNAQIKKRLSNLMLATLNESKKDQLISRLSEITGKSVDAITFALDPEYHDKITAPF